MWRTLALLAVVSGCARSAAPGAADATAAADGADDSPPSASTCGDAEVVLCCGAGPICDGTGRSACVDAYQGYLDAGYAHTVCGGGGLRCAPADRCTDFADAASCACGAGPMCGRGQACVSDTPDATPTCRCVVR